MNYEDAKRIVDCVKVSFAVEDLPMSKEVEDIGIKVAMGEITADEAICILNKKRFN